MPKSEKKKQKSNEPLILYYLSVKQMERDMGLLTYLAKYVAKSGLTLGFWPLPSTASPCYRLAQGCEGTEERSQHSQASH